MTTHSSVAVGVGQRRSSRSPHVRFAILAIGIAIAMFLAMMLFLEIGRQLGLSQTAKLGESARVGVGLVDGAVFAVLSLLLGFTFHGATTRYDRRRDLIAGEISAISTAWSRVDTLPAEPQHRIRVAFRRYVDAVLTQHMDAEAPGSEEAARQLAATARAQNETWQLSIEACINQQNEKARMLLLPSLNEMFDAVDKERLARLMHPPAIIWVMLTVAALAAATFAGYSMASGPEHNWIYIVGTAATISIVTYVIIELEYPRFGFVRIGELNQELTDLRATLH
jgi:hypothetical protein